MALSWTDVAPAAPIRGIGAVVTASGSATSPSSAYMEAGNGGGRSPGGGPGAPGTPDAPGVSGVAPGVSSAPGMPSAPGGAGGVWEAAGGSPRGISGGG